MRAQVGRVLRRHFREALASVLPTFREDRRGTSNGMLWTAEGASQPRLYVQVLFHPRMDAFTVYLIVNHVDESLVVPEYIDPAEAIRRPMAKVALYRFWDKTPGVNPWYWRLGGLSRLEGLATFLLDEPAEKEAGGELIEKASQAIEGLGKHGARFFSGIKGLP